MDQVLEDKLLVKYDSPKSDTKKREIWVILYLLNKQNPLRKRQPPNASTTTELRNDSHKIKEEREGRKEDRKEG